MTRSRCRSTPPPTGASPNASRAPASTPGTPSSVVHVSAGNPFRRWPEPAFARLVAGLVTADAAAPHRPQLRAVGPHGRRSHRGRGAHAILGPPLAARVLDFGDIDLAELRALIERSGLFVGGDTGPLHIAATTRTPIVGIYGPTLAARSAPWRDPRAADRIGAIDGSCRAGRASSGCASQATSGA